ncbi:hypothetical protein IFR05_011724 [Cadophora sp. M221]|nr:hypothetical protein IFR05_011724 [Cadophora sp. M221]
MSAFDPKVLFICAIYLQAILVPIIAFVDKHFTINDGDTYGYDYIPARYDNATFLFINGYHSSRHDWRYRFTDLTKLDLGLSLLTILVMETVTNMSILKPTI